MIDIKMEIKKLANLIKKKTSAMWIVYLQRGHLLHEGLNNSLKVYSPNVEKGREDKWLLFESYVLYFILFLFITLSGLYMFSILPLNAP